MDSPEVTAAPAHDARIVRLLLMSLAWAFAGAIVLCHVLTLYHSAVDFPVTDDFTQLLRTPSDIKRLPTWKLKLDQLVASTGDHRIATQRLTTLVQTQVLGQLNFRGLLFWGNGLCLAAGLLILRSLGNPALRAGLAPLAAAALTSPINFANQYWASASLQHFALSAYAFASLYFLNRTSVASRASAFFFMLCAALTGSNGVLVLFSWALLLLLRKERAAAAVCAAIVCVAVPLYFVGHHAAPGQPSALDVLSNPSLFVPASLAVLGSIAGEFDMAVLIGSLQIGVWLFLMRRGLENKVSPVHASWMLMIVLCCGAIALGRASFGHAELLNGRYAIYSGLGILVTLSAVLARVRTKTGIVVLLLAFPVVGLWFWQTRLRLIDAADFIAQANASRLHYAVTGHGIYERFPPQEFADALLKQADEDGYFRRRAANATPLSPVIADFRAPSDSTMVIAPQAHGDASTLTVSGVVRSNEREVFVWLERSGNYLRAPVLTWPVRGPLEGPAPLAFAQVLSLEGVPHGQYRVGYSAGDPKIAQVTWVAEAVDLR